MSVICGHMLLLRHNKCHVFDKCKRPVCCCYCSSTRYVVDIGRPALLPAVQCTGPADFLVLAINFETCNIFRHCKESFNVILCPV